MDRKYIIETKLSGYIKNDKIINDLINLNHPYSNIGVIPIISENQSIDVHLISETINEINNLVKEHWYLDLVDDVLLKKDIIKKIDECITIEKKYKPTIEELAKSIILNEFNIPEDSIDFNIELIDSPINDIKSSNNELDDKFVFTSHDDIVNANKILNKFKVLKLLLNGASMHNNFLYKKYSNILRGLNPKLNNLYGKIMSFSDYLMLTQNTNDGDKVGEFEIEYIQKDGKIKPIIKVKGIILPVILHELTKGIMYLLMSKGLPDDDITLKYLNKELNTPNVDFWGNIFGYKIWDNMVDNIPYNNDYVKYNIFNSLSMEEPDIVIELVREVGLNTILGNDIINEYYNHIINNGPYFKENELKI